MLEIDYLCGECSHRLRASRTPYGQWQIVCSYCYSGAEDDNPDDGVGDTIEDAIEDYRDSCDLHDRPGPVSIHDLEEVQAEGEAIFQELGPSK